MRYKHIIFDVDGTLINTEEALLMSLRDTIYKYNGKIYTIDDLRFSFGIPGKVSLKKLGVLEEDLNSVLDNWIENIDKYNNKIHFYEGIVETIKELEKYFKIGVITSKMRSHYEDFINSSKIFKDSFKISICADDTENNKPDPEPMLKYLELANINPNYALYIGDSIYDMKCATSAGVDFGLVLWDGYIKDIDCKYSFKDPKEILKLLLK